MFFVLLLTSIVISLAFAYFNTFQRYLQNQNKVTTYEMQVLRFESLMYYDFDRANALHFKHGVLICSGTNVEYEFNDKNIIRYQNNETDSLKGDNINYFFYYAQKRSSEIIGLELEVTDFHNRKRVYAFTKENDEKTKFENFNKQR